MERIEEVAVEELGVASEETRGGTVFSIEPGGLLNAMSGIDGDD